jgi:hypothetical protein
VGTDITVTTASRPASGLGQISPEPYVQHSDVLGSPSQGPPPVQVSVTGVDLGHPGLGPLATARLVSSRAFAPDLHIPMARAQAPPKLGGQVNIVYVRATSAAAVGTVTGEISRLLPSVRVTNSASLAGGMAGSLQTTARLARSPSP